MKLTDQEQVILKAIGHGVAQISRVIKAVGYPKATTKKVLIALSNKGVVSLHRHDWPASLSPTERKLMVKIGHDYFNAVSVRERNPTILDERIPTRDVASTLLALSRSPFDGMIGAYGDDVRGAYAHPSVLYLLFYAGVVKQEGGEYRIPHEAVQRAAQIVDAFYNDKRKSISGKQFLNAWRTMKAKKNPKGKHLPGLPAKKQRQYEHVLASELDLGRSLKRAKRIAAGRVRKMANPKKTSKGKEALKTTGRALKKAASSVLGAGSQILGAGAKALNPSRRKRNSARFSSTQWANEMARLRDIKPRPLHKLYGRSGGTPEQQATWKEAMREWNKQYRHASKMQKIALEEDNAAFRARQQQNKSKRRRNLDHRDSTHQVKVHQHWRAGGLSQWQRAHHAGQHDLFAHGIKAKAKRNPKKGAPGGSSKWVVEQAGKAKRRGWSTETTIKEIVNHLAITGGSRQEIERFVRPYVEKTYGKKTRNASRASHSKSLSKARARASSAGRKTEKTSLRSLAKTRKGATRRVALKKSSSVKGKRRNALKRAKMPAWIKTAIKRAKVYGADRAGGDAWMHAPKVQRDAFDQYLVSIGHPLAYEAGTQEYRIKRFVRERAGKRNPSAESIRKQFAGSVSGSRDLFFPQGTPAGKLAKLGKLVSITTKAGTIKPVHGTAWLCADTKGKLHIGSTSQAPLIDGPARNFGHVTKLEYESSKPHLGYKGPIIWFHRVGEENKIRPTLRADGKGGLVFRGGAYRLTSRGIEN